MTVDAGLVERVRRRLLDQGATPTAARVAAEVRSEGVVLDDRGVLVLLGAVREDLAGAGVLEPLLRDPFVTDVLVNAPDEVWLDRGDGLVRAAVAFPDAAAVRRLAQRLAATAGRRLDTASPTVDARLSAGVRLHAVLPPVSPRGPLLSLRIPRRRAFSIVELVAAGSLAAEMAEVLREVVRSRLAFLVTGGTGTGKTTVLSTLLGEVDATERIVLVEDSGELRPEHPHVVRLEARPPNVEGAGAVELRDLVRQALRMRPDRLVVGEVRGPEVVDLLAALNTGHDGGCGTVHANASASLPSRLEALAVAAGLGRAALHSQLAAGVQVVVHLARGRDGQRAVSEVGVVERDVDTTVRVLPALSTGRGGHVQEGPGAARLAALIAGPA
ncbi:MAG: pilus assembly protein CpaF [Actinomycetota bacterium]|jgi:pilus assembly protein CpaF|nr:pilus assembly protein CpaF [Actinomycetota bacterium]